MSSKKPNTQGTREVIVEIPTHDDDGNPITDDMLSSGGARDHGPIVKQYTNPRPYVPAPVRSDEDLTDSWEYDSSDDSANSESDGLGLGAALAACERGPLRRRDLEIDRK